MKLTITKRTKIADKVIEKSVTCESDIEADPTTENEQQWIAATIRNVLNALDIDLQS